MHELIRVRRLASLAVFGFLLTACQTYQPKPLSRELVERALAAPDLEALARAYAPVTHPMLPAIEIDPTDGIDPLEAACLAAVLNPALRAERARRGIAAAQLVQAGLLPNPQLSATVDVPSGGATGGTVTALGLGVAWDVGALIEHRANLDAARAQDRAAALDMLWQEWQVASAARLAATQAAWRSQACVALRRAADDAESALATIEAAVEAREATALSEAAARATLQSYRARLRTAELARDLAALEARRAIGLPPDTEITFEAASTTAPPDATLKALFAAARDRRPDLAALRFGYDAQEHRLHAAVLAQFPRLSIGLNGARDTGDVQTIGLGVSVDLPIFDRAQGRIAAEHATRDQLLAEYIDRAYTLRADLAAARAELDRLAPAIEAQRAYVAATSHTLTLIEQDEANHLLDVFSVQQQRIEAVDARLTLIELLQRQDELAVALSTEAGFLLERTTP